MIRKAIILPVIFIVALAFGLVGCDYTSLLPQQSTDANTSPLSTDVPKPTLPPPLPTEMPTNKLPINARPAEIIATGNIPGGVYKNVTQDWVNVEVALKYTLRFWNVGVLSSDKYGEATLSIEYRALNNGVVLGSPDAKGNRAMKPATRYPYFPADIYKLSFSGGPQGKFQQVGQNLDHPIMGQLTRDDKGILSLLFYQGLNNPTKWDFQNAEAFNVWK